MSVRARHLQAAGALLDNYSRDTAEILALGFPVFSQGPYAQDQGARGKVVDYGVPAEIAGIAIRPGDILFGDRDGVLVLPREAEEEAVRKALERPRPKTGSAARSRTA